MILSLQFFLDFGLRVTERTNSYMGLREGFQQNGT